MRSADFDIYLTYWRLAVRGRMREAEAWRLANQWPLSIFEDMPMCFSGYYRTKKNVPVAFWLHFEVDDAGELLGPPELVLWTGRGKPQREKDLTHGNISFAMTWERCRHDAVTEAAYRYAVEHYDSETGYPWADRPPKPPERERPDLRDSPPIF